MEVRTPCHPHQGRPAAHLRRVHPAPRRARGRSARADREHRRGRRRLRHHHPPAHARPDHRRTDEGDRRVGEVSRKKIFTCRPTKRRGRGSVRGEDPARPDDARVSRQGRRHGLQDAMKFYEEGRKTAATSRAASASRCSPSSSARASCSAWKAARRSESATGTYRVADLDLASRLSFFIWGSGPDAELIKAAELGQLSTVAGIEQPGAPHARRQALRGAVHALCLAVAAAAGPRDAASRSSPSTRSSTKRSATRCAAKPSSSSTASSARIATSSTC